MYLLVSLLQLQLRIPVQLTQCYNETKRSINIDAIRTKMKTIAAHWQQHNITVKLFIVRYMYKD